MTNESEEWRPAPDYEGIYEVSSWGRVRRIKPGISTHAGKILSPGTWKSGHEIVNLRRDGVGKTQSVHRLVARAFLGEPPPDKPMVLHWDDDPANNRVENLRWGSRSENRLDSVRNGGDHNATRTECHAGHPYLDGSFFWYDNSRVCRECHRERGRKNKARQRRGGVAPAGKHGPNGYANYGCRCGVCTESAREYSRMMYRKRKDRQIEQSTKKYDKKKEDSE